MTETHIGVEVFKILVEKETIKQNELVRYLEDKGFKKNKIYLYLRYILIVPIPISDNEFTEPMVRRQINFYNNNVIELSLNKYWRDTDEEAVAKLFDMCDPTKY